MINRLLPEILAVRRRMPESRQVVLDLNIPENIVHFSGHFPGMAILPGVVQIDWAVRFAREHFVLTSEFTMLENIKFRTLILPNAQLELALQWNRDSRESIDFSFATSERKYSLGRIVFGAAT